MPTMRKLINLTQARSSLSGVITDVATNKMEYILIRDSIPQAVIIPFEQYQRQEEKWEEEFRRLVSDSRKRFKKYLRKRAIKYPKTEEEMCEFVNQVTGRY